MPIDSTVEGKTARAGNVLSGLAASATDGFRRASADAADAAERHAPAIKRSVSKSTYMLAYCLSFGTVYVAEVVKEMLPDDGVVMQAFRDGAAAARQSRATHDAEVPATVTTTAEVPAI